MPWSGQTVRISLDPFAPVTPGVINPAASFVNSLMQEPTGITPLPNPVTTFANLGTSVFNTFNPFVIGTQCGFCAPFVPGSGVTFAQAIQNSIESFLSLIPGYQGPLPTAATTDPQTALTASSEPNTPAQALAASSTAVDATAVDATADTPTTAPPTKRAQHRQGLKTALSGISQDPAADATATDESQDPATDTPVRKRQASTNSTTDAAGGSATAKQPGPLKSVADHVKAAVGKGTDSKAGDSKGGDSAK